jgi:nanoRNase/pAp phosphatase (c-di-AMP/oligoRNAs hydrolase)
MIKVLFHSYGDGKHCYDGFGAAFVAWIQFRNEAQYIPCVYQQPAPEVNPGDIVYIFDFTYPRETLLAWSEIATVHVLDHHKSAQAALDGLDFAEFDMERSGAQMVWDEFVADGHGRPPIIDYIADRDLWRKKLPHTEEVSRALASFPFDFEVWYTLANLPNYVDFMRRIGEPLQKAHEEAVQRLAETAYLKDFGGYTVQTIRTDHYNLVSDALNLLCKMHPETPFAVNFYPKEDGLKYELRSIGDFDVSEVARRFGGGGHKNAAGCFIPFEKPAR